MKYAREALFYSVISIFLITAIVTLLGVTEIIPIKSKYLTVLFSALIIELIGAVLGLFKATDWFGKADNTLGSREIEGCWWQFVRYEKETAISFVQIEYSSDQQQLVIEGVSYDAKGNPYARWWSVGASYNVASYELRYFWKGDHENEENDFSGIGLYRFSREVNERSLNQASGWFTSGDIDNLEVTGKLKVILRRLSIKDMKKMLSSDKKVRGKLASFEYSKWNSGSVNNSV